MRVEEAKDFVQGRPQIDVETGPAGFCADGEKVLEHVVRGRGKGRR
jgi:hypothetical protein